LPGFFFIHLKVDMERESIKFTITGPLGERFEVKASGHEQCEKVLELIQIFLPPKEKKQ